VANQNERPLTTLAILRKCKKRTAILWKRWRLSGSPEDKLAYSTAAVGCKALINKFHAARELALIRKNNLGSYYKLVNSKIKSNLNGAALRTANGQLHPILVKSPKYLITFSVIM